MKLQAKKEASNPAAKRVRRAGRKNVMILRVEMPGMSFGEEDLQIFVSTAAAIGANVLRDQCRENGKSVSGVRY